ncbi:hypothetical protein BV22DRAFT_904378 [Leucogyrophana mollusca]|uniref:Uncharacterized protein n=1 Tax=Leucogyrophana mollusca TaxID=85980 RepID=A0ACB8AZ96_9AGAM|nr:hypothetical protein BV22DRAFT_904378 [Leucogyrophana mollusca]
MRVIHHVAFRHFCPESRPPPALQRSIIRLVLGLGDAGQNIPRCARGWEGYLSLVGQITTRRSSFDVLHWYIVLLLRSSGIYFASASMGLLYLPMAYGARSRPISNENCRHDSAMIGILCCKQLSSVVFSVLMRAYAQPPRNHSASPCRIPNPTKRTYRSRGTRPLHRRQTRKLYLVGDSDGADLIL